MARRWPTFVPHQEVDLQVSVTFVTCVRQLIADCCTLIISAVNKKKKNEQSHALLHREYESADLIMVFEECL